MQVHLYFFFYLTLQSIHSSASSFLEDSSHRQEVRQNDFLSHMTVSSHQKKPQSRCSTGKSEIERSREAMGSQSVVRLTAQIEGRKWWRGRWSRCVLEGNFAHSPCSCLDVCSSGGPVWNWRDFFLLRSIFLKSSFYLVESEFPEYTVNHLFYYVTVSLCRLLPTSRNIRDSVRASCRRFCFRGDRPHLLVNALLEDCGRSAVGLITWIR